MRLPVRSFSSACRQATVPRVLRVPFAHGPAFINHGMSSKCHVLKPVVPRAAAVNAANSVVESGSEATAEPDRSSKPTSPIVKIAKGGDLKLIAGRIAHVVRQGEAPVVVCVGAACTNVGVKSIAVSRSYLAEEYTDVAFRPLIRSLGDAKDGKKITGLQLVTLTSRTPSIPTTPVEGDQPQSQPVEMMISASGDPQKIAGAIAARVREGKTTLKLTAIGPAAVYQATKALARAGAYLRGDRKSIRVAPSFYKVTKEDRVVNAIKLDVNVEGIPAKAAAEAAATTAEAATAARR